MKAQFTIVLALLGVLAIPVPAQEVEFNYEGRVSVDGLPYTGPGYFKFAIVNGDGSITYWSNDGTSVAGSEPAAAVVTDVTDSVFNIIIGDASQANMQPLEASIFNGYEQVFLRVWFSDGVLSFEHLASDRRITNPALLGSQSFREIHLYVNPTTGDDQYPGTSPAYPKRSIQAGWDTLPPMIRENATIHLADGVYRETVLLSGKTVIGEATISLVGNETTPSAVRITGADTGAETTPVRETGFLVNRQDSLFLTGLYFDYFDLHALALRNMSSIVIKGCVFMNNLCAIHAFYSQLYVDEVDIGAGLFSAGPPRGITLNKFCFIEIHNCNISDQSEGVFMFNSTLEPIAGTTLDNCTNGLHANFSFVRFRDPQSTISNCVYGVFGGQNSSMGVVGTVPYYESNTQNTVFTTGTVYAGF